MEVVNVEIVKVRVDEEDGWVSENSCSFFSSLLDSRKNIENPALCVFVLSCALLT